MQSLYLPLNFWSLLWTTTTKQKQRAPLPWSASSWWCRRAWWSTLQEWARTLARWRLQRMCKSWLWRCLLSPNAWWCGNKTHFKCNPLKNNTQMTSSVLYGHNVFMVVLRKCLRESKAYWVWHYTPNLLCRLTWFVVVYVISAWIQWYWWQ